MLLCRWIADFTRIISCVQQIFSFSGVVFRVLCRHLFNWWARWWV